MTYLQTPQADNWTRLDRFLVLGSADGNYRIAECPLTIERAGAVRDCLKIDGLRVVQAVVQVSASGKAPRNEPALFALALSASPDIAGLPTNAAALAALPQVARTGADLRTFVGLIEGLRGWGRGLRSAVADWYLGKPAGELATQLLRDRDSTQWPHRDLLRLSHPKAETAAHNALFQWAVDGQFGHLATGELMQGELRAIYAHELAKQAASESEIVSLIEDYGLSHETIPSEWRTSARVWEALLESAPYAVMVDHLGRLTEIGLIAPHSTATALVVARLIDRKRIANANIHPVALLTALSTYKQGGPNWSPISNVVNALEEAFYLAFDNVEPAGARIYLGIDANLGAGMGPAAMAMLMARSGSNPVIVAFQDEIWPLNITREQRFEQVCGAMQWAPCAADAALPVKDALKRGTPVDAFVIVTNNEIRSEEIERYRHETGIAAKLVVMAMSGDRNGIAESNESWRLGIIGFDASVPGVVADFIRGR